MTPAQLLLLCVLAGTASAAIDTKKWLESAKSGRGEDSVNEVLQVLRTMESNSGWVIGDIDAAVDGIFALWKSEDFILKPTVLDALLQMSPTLSNLIAASRHRTTDAVITELAGQLTPIRKQHEQVLKETSLMCKVLVLTSARNEQMLPVFPLSELTEHMFLKNHVSYWVSNYLRLYETGLANPTALRNLNAVLSSLSWFEHIGLDPNLHSSFYGATFINGTANLDSQLKQHLNLMLQLGNSVHETVQKGEKPELPKSLPAGELGWRYKQKIAVISARLTDDSVAMRLLKPYFKALAKAGYKLHLLALSERSQKQQKLDKQDKLWTEVKSFGSGSELGKVRQVIAYCQQEKFATVLYPAMGTTFAEVLLANSRLAPIQIAMLGHPVSGFGTQTDYFISGQDVEPVKQLARDQSWVASKMDEQAVLIPGYGVSFPKPTFTPAWKRTRYSKTKAGKPGIDATKLDSSDVLAISIAIPASPHKVNAEFLMQLAGGIQAANSQTRAELEIKLLILGDGIEIPVVSELATYAFERDVQHTMDAVLRAPGAKKPVQVTVEFGYGAKADVYMTKLEAADFVVDTWHYGGSTTVADALHLARPILLSEGQLWYNRIGPVMLRAVSPQLATELIASTRADFAAKVARLILDGQYRSSLVKQLQAADLTPLYADSRIPVHPAGVPASNHAEIAAGGDCTGEDNAAEGACAAATGVAEASKLVSATEAVVRAMQYLTRHHETLQADRTQRREAGMQPRVIFID